MKYIIGLIASLLVYTNAYADLVPDGCYVAFNNPDYCWVSSNGITEWTEFSNRNDGAYKYGNTVEAIIYNGKLQKLAKEKEQQLKLSCQSDYNTLSSQFANSDAERVAAYNSLVGEYNTLLAEKTKLAASVTKLQKQIKKLKGKKK